MREICFAPMVAVTIRSRNASRSLERRNRSKSTSSFEASSRSKTTPRWKPVLRDRPHVSWAFATVGQGNACLAKLFEPRLDDLAVDAGVSGELCLRHASPLDEPSEDKCECAPCALLPHWRLGRYTTGSERNTLTQRCATRVQNCVASIARLQRSRLARRQFVTRSTNDSVHLSRFCRAPAARTVERTRSCRLVCAPVNVTKTERGRQWTAPRGSMTTIELPPLVWLTFVGLGHEVFAKAIHETLDEWIALGMVPLQIFVDASELVTIEPGFRARSIDWVLRNRAHVVSVRAFTQSRLISMGISLSRLFVGDVLVAFNDKESLEREWLDATRMVRDRTPDKR